MSGTNDALLGKPLGDTYRGLLTKMVSRVRELGPVPVLSTLPPMAVLTENGQPGEERIAEANRIIREVASTEQVPLIDLHSALVAPGMVNQGSARTASTSGLRREAQPDVMRLGHADDPRPPLRREPPQPDLAAGVGASGSGRRRAVSFRAGLFRQSTKPACQEKGSSE